MGRPARGQESDASWNIQAERGRSEPLLIVPYTGTALAWRPQAPWLSAGTPAQPRAWLRREEGPSSRTCARTGLGGSSGEGDAEGKNEDEVRKMVPPTGAASNVLRSNARGLFTFQPGISFAPTGLRGSAPRPADALPPALSDC